MIEASAPNNYQQIVTFADGERLLINNADLTGLNDAIVSESSGRTYPKEYSEAIAALKEQHKQELERLGGMTKYVYNDPRCNFCNAESQNP
ncbi:hypothetical protein [Nostoc flagelliforme]|uniref:hypothetical protein n=1 Tax=Nostoc flagelliforme TaxID=1306274 RepID=UPI001CEDD451|nr:hypothetical protein [Nostoc flagelliforme]